MDEVDNEDLEELESRLYSQIHHENIDDGAEMEETALQRQPIEDIQRTVTSMCVINNQAGSKKSPAGRYWAYNPSKYEKAMQPTQKESVYTAAESDTLPDKLAAVATTVNQTLKTPPKPKPNPPAEQLSSFQSPGPKNTKAKSSKPTFFNTGKPNPIQPNKNSKRNVAPAMQGPRMKPNKQKNKQQPLPPNVQKDGPFAKQTIKLQKAVRYEAKKQKSQKSRPKKQSLPVDVIDLDSSSDTSDGDEVIIIPQPPAPLIVVDDSDDNDEVAMQIIAKTKNKQNGNTKRLFTKPISTDTENKTVPEFSSRCDSPGSVMSSDDFIGHSDRSRLLSGSGVADDEDLQLLTADVDSLMEAPQRGTESTTQANDGDEHELSDCVEEYYDKFAERAQNSRRSNNYRVEDGTEFRALDVYESESDITENVYAKGASKPQTVIRSIDSSSEGESMEDIGLNKFNKHLRKRCFSNSSKGSEGHADDSSDSECDSNNGVSASAVPFISRGPAVEQYGSKKRNNPLCSTRRTSQGGRMSDSDFIATISNLAQGGSEIDTDVADADEDSDVENMPTARDIAESVLQKKRQTQPTTQTAETSLDRLSETVNEDHDHDIDVQEARNALSICNAAVPETMLANLDDVFNKIDQLAQPKQLVSRSDPVEVDEPSSEDEEERVIAESTELAASLKPKCDAGGPIYHVIYSRGNHLSGGIGWNDEMRKFYNNLWDGEHFALKKVLQKLDARKNLWKIYTEDRFPKSRRFSNLKCHNCCEFGHTRAKCTRPRKPSICYMCGESGHFEPRCPNTICLRCGNKTHVYTKSCNACTFQNRLICPLCKVRGHTLNFCPDKWRRYHSTTEINIYPDNHVEYKNKKCCCICGGRGHWSETCKSAVRFMEYPIIVSEIKSHQKSYSDQSLRAIQSGIAFNLLYETSKDYSFELAEETKPQNYYGRFLRSVGMAYMLNRKRKTDADIGNSAKKMSKTFEEYVPNSYVRTLREERVERAATTNAPEQVAEISESNNQEIVAAVEEPPLCMEDTEMEATPLVIEVAEILDANSQGNEITTEFIAPHENGIVEKPVEIPMETNADSNSFKSPTEVASHIQSSTIRSSNDVPCCADSDSNYSFSEHYESSTIPNTASLETTFETTEMNTDSPIVPAAQQTNSRGMSPLPDFIPLTSTTDDAEENLDIYLSTGGLSTKYVAAFSDDEDAGNPLSDLPCEAKIYLTHFHSKYFLSPQGSNFLLETAKACNIRAHLDWTSVGHVLIIFGLQSNQNQFHRELLQQYNSLSDQMNRKRSLTGQKVPKRADTLIRFLRENINQLQTKLGNVNEVLRRLRQQERQNSKTGWKLAEKARRTLNMILLGQGGLLDGNMHLDKLLLFLKTLINNYEPDTIISDDFRNNIDKHWKMIFTPFRHDNYPELVRSYNNLVSKNRIPKLNIDPILLGKKVLDTKLTNEQKTRLEQSPSGGQKKHNRIVPNPLNPGNIKLLNKKQNTLLNVQQSLPGPSTNLNTVENSPNKAPPAPSMKIEVNPKPNNNETTAKSVPTAKFVQPQKPSTVASKIKEVSENWESTCTDLLTKIDGSLESPKNGPVLNCKAPSMFWSRESIKYVDECIKMAESNNHMLEKLQRVQTKSKNGSLSYNDYRAVIKLHGAMLGK